MRFAHLLAAASVAAVTATPALAQDDDAAADAFVKDIQIYGRVMLDQTFAGADNADVNFTTSDARRLRIGARGKLGDRVKWNFELNTDSSGEINAEDAWIQFYPTGDRWSVVVGQDNTHNSFSELTSSRFLPIAERAAFTDAFQLDRRVGVSILNDGANWTAAAGIHTTNLENGGDQEGWAASARVTGTPVNTPEFLGHLGAHWRYRDQGSSDDDLRYRQRPLSASLDRIISTGRVADSDNLFGVEAYGLFDEGRYWAGGEYVVTDANGTEPVLDEDLDFSGGQLIVGTMFGGGRTYKNGKWNRPRVDNPFGDNGYGALMIEARFDTLDLTDSAVDGGQLDTYAVNADWWLTDSVHIGATAFLADADLGTSTSGLGSDFASLVTAGFEEEEVSGVVIRAQFDFGTPAFKF